jgi:prevent-host-death family protein
MDTFSVTDLRHKTNIVLKRVAEKGMVYLVRHSKSEAAIVDAAYFNALKEAYENYLDTMEFDRTISLKRIPLETHLRARKKT